MEMQDKTSEVPNSKSIEEYSHAHPYQYLTKLNEVFHNYSKSTTKDYSAPSKIKLPFYKFSSIKVPSVFQASYHKEHRQLVSYNSVEVCKTDDGDRKLWKEHQEIIQNYLHHKKESRQKSQKTKNSEFVLKILAKDKNNIFLKKIVEKGTTFDYDQGQLQQEVLHKLKNLRGPKSKQMVRCQTAKCLSSQGKGIRIEDHTDELTNDRVSQKDYLECEHEHQLVKKYKEVMKKADFSISEKNIKKTSDLISKMQVLARRQIR